MRSGRLGEGGGKIKMKRRIMRDELPIFSCNHREEKAIHETLGGDFCFCKRDHAAYWLFSPKESSTFSVKTPEAKLVDTGARIR